MKQPKSPSEPPQTSASANQAEPKRSKKVPTAQELISHYQSRGLDERQASVKVVEDLQNALLRFVSASRKEKLASSGSSRKIDAVVGRLAAIDAKLDSKPGYAGSFALGLASGVALNGVGSVWPHVLSGFGRVWSAVSSVSNPSSSSPSS